MFQKREQAIFIRIHDRFSFLTLLLLNLLIISKKAIDNSEKGDIINTY